MRARYVKRSIRLLGRDVVLEPEEHGVKNPLSFVEFSRICDYGTICYPSKQDLERYPQALAVVFFDATEEMYLLADDGKGGRCPSQKMAIGGFIWLRGGRRLYFGPGMSDPVVSEDMVTTDPHEHECREMPPSPSSQTSALDQRIIDLYDKEKVEAMDKAMVERRMSEGHFSHNGRVQYLTPSLMRDLIEDDEVPYSISSHTEGGSSDECHPGTHHEDQVEQHR